MIKDSKSLTDSAYPLFIYLNYFISYFSDRSPISRRIKVKKKTSLLIYAIAKIIKSCVIHQLY